VTDGKSISGYENGVRDGYRKENPRAVAGIFSGLIHSRGSLTLPLHGPNQFGIIESTDQ
jgi:hypothetical protein